MYEQVTLAFPPGTVSSAFPILTLKQLMESQAYSISNQTGHAEVAEAIDSKPSESAPPSALRLV